MKLTDISPAIALTPLDGRYHKATAPLVEYMREPALIFFKQKTAYEIHR